MTREERVAAVKAGLVRSIDAAKAKGAIILCDIDRVERDDGAFVCCALASLDVAMLPGLRLPFSDDSDEMAQEWDSVEMGFDGRLWASSLCQGGTPVLADFWLLGAELREQYQPVPVAVFLAPQEAREEAALAGRVRFT